MLEAALQRASELLDAGDDVEAARQVEVALKADADNAQARVLKQWLEKFGRGSAADNEVQRVLVCPDSDFYAVLGVPRYMEPPRAEYLKLSRQLHPDRCGARNASEAYQRVTEAYRTLTDPTERAKADSKLRRAEGTHRAGHGAASSAGPFGAACNTSQRPGCGGFGAAGQRPGDPNVAPSSLYPVAQLRDACSRLPVDQLVLALERLGEVTNTRSHNKLVEQLRSWPEFPEGSSVLSILEQLLLTAPARPLSSSVFC